MSTTIETGERGEIKDVENDPNQEQENDEGDEELLGSDYDNGILYAMYRHFKLRWEIGGRTAMAKGKKGYTVSWKHVREKYVLPNNL